MLLLYFAVGLNYLTVVVDTLYITGAWRWLWNTRADLAVCTRHGRIELLTWKTTLEN